MHNNKKAQNTFELVDTVLKIRKTQSHDTHTCSSLLVSSLTFGLPLILSKGGEDKLEIVSLRCLILNRP